MKSLLSANLQSDSNSNSSFFKPRHRRSIAFVGTSGLLLGVGFSGSSPALSNGLVNCTVDNTVYASGNSDDQRSAIQDTADETNVICLSGNFEINGPISFSSSIYSDSNAIVYGIGQSSIKSPGGNVFLSTWAKDDEWDLTIENLTIKDSVLPVQGYNVYIKDSTFLNNSNDAYSSIRATGNVEVVNSTFIDNTSTSDGGAIWASGEVNVVSSEFSQNFAGDAGGAIFALGLVSITNSTLSQNSAENEGGAVLSAADVTLSNSVFSSNSVNSSGGAIWSYGSVLITNSSLSENSADDDGGAVYASGGAIVSNSAFSMNSVDRGGGAIYSDSGDTEISGSTFTENSARDGGAIYAWSDPSLEISNSSFFGNSAVDDGGAVYGEGKLAVSGSTFFDNSAIYGGALYADWGETVLGTVDVDNSTFVQNRAIGTDVDPGAEGGAIYAFNGEVLFSTFVNNTAPTPPDEGDTPGNAIYKSGADDFSIGASIFAGDSIHPQLGVGLPSPTLFADLGGNVFSTSSAVETDIVEIPAGYPDNLAKHSTTLFGKSLLQLFGSSTPSLASYAPNSTGPKTLGLVVGSPALTAVPNRAPFNTFTLDQRGATRSFPASAGAFDGVAPVAPTPTPTPSTAPAAPAAPAALAKTGSENPVWASLASGSMIVVGVLVTAVASRLRRRTK